MNKLAILAIAALTACTATEEMIAAQADRCTKVGYQPGTTDHAQCVERGTLQQQELQNAATGAVIATGLAAALVGAYY